LRRKLIVAGVVVIIAAVTIWSAGSILSAPAKQHVGELPSDLSGQSIEFQSESGATIHGWFIRGEKGAGAILLMHGVRSNRLSLLERARFLSRAGYSVLCIDLQAHGESSGDRITFGYLESRDAQAAVKFLRTQAPDERIAVIGISLGGAAALLASPRLEVDAIVLEMVYPTIEEAVSNRLTMRLGRWASLLTPLFMWQIKPRLGVGPEALRPIDRVGEISAPKFFIAGSADQHTTVAESRRMYELAREPKELWIVDGAEHVDLHSFVGKEYERRVLGFFEKYLRSR